MRILQSTNSWIQTTIVMIAPTGTRTRNRQVAAGSTAEAQWPRLCGSEKSAPDSLGVGEARHSA
jgi:hypothetical protein